MALADSWIIPPELTENVARGSCVLFLGADYPLGPAGPPTRAQLAQALSARYELDPAANLAAAAQDFLRRRPGDRHGLVSCLREQTASALLLPPGEVHQAIATIGFDAVVTAWYDDMLERAFRAAGKTVACMVSGLDVAYTSCGEDAIVVKLYGDIGQPASLVLTRRDMLKVEGHLAQRLEDVRPYVRLRPIVFVGWDPADETLARLYAAATEALGEHKRRNYIIWPTPRPEDVAWWEEDNVAIIPAEPLSFLQTLQRLVQQQRQCLPAYCPGEVVGKLPYKFLDYYDPEDRDIFCGREVDAPLIYRMALSYPLLTLFGQSGVGKTSLLRAGVVPLLQEEGYLYAYVRALGDPLQAVRVGVGQALGLADCPGATLRDFFQAALGKRDRLVVILDQFEELFTRASISKHTRRAFWRELGACLGLERPEVHFILCLREDFLAALDEARRPLAEGEPAPVPLVLRNSYRLTSLEADAAYLAIVEPARRACCTVEPLLAEVLLGRAPMPSAEGGDTPEGGPAWALAQADGTVPPPALQVVMDCLYRQALAAAGREPPAADAASRQWVPPALELTLAQYRALGGAGAILAAYVQEALDQVPARGGDRRIAETLLKVMVTGQKTKAALDDTEIAAELAQADAGFDSADLDCLQATRAALVDLRLVRCFKVGEAVLYELAHDHMVTEIATWISQEEMQGKLVREQLRRDLVSWRDLGRLIDPATLQLIHAQREQLRRLGREELELLFRSALAVGQEVPYWFMRARATGVAVDEIACTELQSQNYWTRAAAVVALGQLGAQFADTIIGMLGDVYPQVRVAAIAALERLRPDGAWRENLVYERYVPAGAFIMGDDDVKPAHEVYLAAYYIGRYPVTNADYRRYREDMGRALAVPEEREDHPAVNVSWYDAREYAAWVGLRTRLPTEAEWEKAASWNLEGAGRRPGEGGEGRKRRYPWGDEFDPGKCNTGESGIGDTTPVGWYSPAGDSPYGVADMAGNVWEWTSSLDKNYPYRADDGREDPAPTGHRVVRGGSWYDNQYCGRCVCRDSLSPDLGHDCYGFRYCWAVAPVQTGNEQ